MTFKDIARKLDCSPSTVSRALNGTAGVKEELRQRILEAVRKEEEKDAEKGRRGRPRGSVALSDIVDIVVFRRDPVEPLIQADDRLIIDPMTSARPNIFFSPRFRLTTDFYRHIVDGVLAALSGEEMKSMMQVRDNLLDADFLTKLKSQRHRGVILLGEPDVKEVRAFIDVCPIPVVLVDILGQKETPVVTIDNFGGIRQSVEYLLSLGHRDIGFAGIKDNPNLHERFSAFCGVMAESGLAVHHEWLYFGDGHIRHVSEGVAPILRANHRPTAMVCANDYFAMGVMQVAKDIGLSVPRDISVIGFDDIDVAPMLSPALTTVSVPKIQLGACGAELLLRATGGNASLWTHCELRCKTELTIRRSVKAIGKMPAMRNDKRSAKT